jgi:very-short-patch-repair endonuclease
MDTNPRLLAHAKRMRHAPTHAEMLLWRRLRAGRLAAYKFRRQQPIGNFIVDFVCFARKVVIEVDGGQHVDMPLADDARTAWLGTEGFRVLRFWNDDVMQRMELVLEEVIRALENGQVP